MSLPLKTTSDDVRKIVNYFKTKPTGATLNEARAALGKQLLDRRKVAAYRSWAVLSRDGDRYKLTQRAWDYTRRPETEQDFFRQIIDSNTAYRSAVEWVYHQGLESVTVVDVAAHWHEHHQASLGADAKDDSIREYAISFFHLCEAAGIGKLTVGRGGNPTRLVIDRESLRRFIEAGPSAPPWTDEAETIAAQVQEEEEGADASGGQSQASSSGDGASAGSASDDSALSSTPPVPEALRVFIAHGKNMEIVDQVQTMLGLADIEGEVAEEEETTAIPVPEKVFNAMKRCRAAIICVSVDEGHTSGDDGPYSINENVLIEIGAAFVLYDRRVVLLWDKRLPVPSNLQGLYRCAFEGDELTWSEGMKLMKAIQGFKK